MFRRLVPLLVLAPLVPAALANGADQGVTTAGNTFSPKTITVAPGDTVTWTNPANGRHSVTFDDGSFDSGTKTDATLARRTFNDLGSFAYHCTEHGSTGGGGMSGVVNVTADGQPTPSSSPGSSVTPTPSPSPGSASPSPSPSPAGEASSPVLTEFGYRPIIKHGKLRGHVFGEPAGADLVVTVKRGGKPAGTYTTTLLAGKTPVVLRLSRSLRRALRAGKRPRVKVMTTLTSGGETVFERRRLRLRAG